MATKRWIGAAVDVPRVYSLTVAGTWANTETATITIDSRDLVITLGATSLTTANVADQIYRAINATSRDDNNVDAHTKNTGGQAIPQFREIEATYDGTSSVLYILGPPGVDITVSVSETAAAGTLSLSSVQTPTGKHYWDNADNWDTGVVPANGDTVWFSDSAVDCLYGFPNGSLTLQNLHVTQSFTGQLGLKPINTSDPNFPYDEYRQRAPIFDNTSAGLNPTYTFGEGNGIGPKYVYVDNDQGDGMKLYVIQTGPKPSADLYNVNVDTCAAGGLQYVTVLSGSVSIRDTPGMSAGDVDTLIVGARGVTTSQCQVRIGVGVTNNDMGVTVNGGYLDTNNAPNSLVVYGGEVLNRGGYQGTTPSLKVYGDGVVRHTSISGGSGLSSVVCSGTLDFSTLYASGTVAVCDLHAGARVIDPGRLVTWSAGLDLNGCGVSDVTLDLGQNHKVTPAAVT